MTETPLAHQPQCGRIRQGAWVPSGECERSEHLTVVAHGGRKLHASLPAPGARCSGLQGHTSRGYLAVHNDF